MPLTEVTSVDQHYLLHRVTAGLRYAEEAAFAKDNGYTLFRAEDTSAWIAFTCVFAILIVFDNVFVFRQNKSLSVMAAMAYTMFWVFCAFLFCGFVCIRYNSNASFSWMSGYLLEWMLSFDNLFVFHLIFSIYHTPDHLKHRPLYLGICGAVFFRLIFIFIGEYLMHVMFLAHFVFGGFLVYTGVKTAVMDDDDDEDPSKNFAVQWLSKTVPFVSAYDSKGSFFVRVPVDENGNALLPQGVHRNSGLPHADDLESEPFNAGGREDVRYGTVDFSSQSQQLHTPATRYQTRATMLFLVVICLEVSDLLFAVDSVSAIVAQVNDLYLAYTSAVFAMLGLRATFFIIDVLVKLFSLLKYGVAAVLVFIGIKLIIGKMYVVPPGVVCFVLFFTLGMSMVASVIHDKYESTRAPKDEVDAKEAGMKAN